MLLKFFDNFDFKNDLLLKLCHQILIFPTLIYVDRKSPKHFSMQFLLSLWKTFIKSNWPPEKLTHVTYKVFCASVLFLVCCRLLYLKRYCHPIQDKTIPGTKANPWNYYVMGLKRWIKLIIKKRFIHIRLTSTKKTDR